MIVHILMDEKFTNDFVFFTNKEFEPKNQCFIVMAAHNPPRYTSKIIGVENVIFVNKNIKGLFKLIKVMKKASKIILHGMFTKHIITLLNFYRLGYKTYWCIWGGDLYEYKNESPHLIKSKIKLISHLKGIISPFKWDYELAQKVYRANGPMFRCLYPTSSVAEKRSIIDIDDGNDGSDANRPVKILLGNSADSENNHFEALDILKPMQDENIHIYIPLSYGDRQYAHLVGETAQRDFGDRVTPMFEFMEKSVYYQFLDSIDVAVFAHKRQQAFNNIAQLMAAGKKIYLHKNGAIGSLMEEIDCKVYDIEELGNTLFIPMSKEQRAINIENFYNNMNYQTLIDGWEAVYKDK